MSEPTSPFARRLIDWQRQHGRQHLPWQHQRDAYRVWLSEVMLQQTQVATVIPYYQRFLAAFPDVRALAAADVERVLEHWSGLGYYSRARHLHRCAQQVVERFDGRFPDDQASLISLPGIGRSTAAAILAFAFGQRAAILDGNVKRVFCRHFGVVGFPGERQVELRLWTIAERELPESDIEPYTQGLMDLGAGVCVRSRPACDRCPVASTCVALRDGLVASLPTRRPRRAPPLRHRTMLVCRDGDRVLLARRPATGIWGGLWSLPELDHDDVAPLPESAWPAALAPLLPTLDAAPGLDAGLLDLAARRATWLPTFTHAFTHYTLLAQPVVLDVPGATSFANGTPPADSTPGDPTGAERRGKEQNVAEPSVAEPAVAATTRPGSTSPDPAGWRWLAPEDVDQAALPTPIRALLRSLDRRGDAT